MFHCNMSRMKITCRLADGETFLPMLFGGHGLHGLSRTQAYPALGWTCQE